MKNMLSAVMAVLLVAAVPLSADLIETRDGKTFHAVVLRESDSGYSILLLDGSRKYITKDEVLRHDRNNNFAQVYFAVAETMDLQEKGGNSYFWLGMFGEKSDRDASRFLFSIALQDDEVAPWAAYQLSLTDTDPQDVIGHLGLSLAGCPWVPSQEVRRLQVAIERLAALERSLDRNELMLFFNVIKEIARNRAVKVNRLWGDFAGRQRSQTIDFLEKLCQSYTGYDFNTISTEMLYLSGSADRKLWQCETCKGSGKVQCSRCKGEGFTQCDKCRGLGFTEKRIASNEGVRITRSKCSSCGGQGFNLCPICKSYTQYQQTKRISFGGGVRTIKVSGYRTCPDCKGSGRKPGAPEISGRVQFVGLNSAETRASFKNLESQVWRLTSSGDTWAYSPAHVPSPSDFARDVRSVRYRFYDGKWYAPSEIDELMASGRYKAPQVNEAMLEQFRSAVAVSAIPLLSKASEQLSGRDRHQAALAELAHLYPFLSNVGDTSTFEFRKFYALTFKTQRDAGTPADVLRPDSEPMFLLRREDSGDISREYSVTITENARASVSQVIENASDVTFYARVVGASRTASPTETGGLSLAYNFEISPIAGIIQRADGKTIQWIKLDTSGRSTGLFIGEEGETED
ncbi:MAG TPA: hypothetical protein ENN09_01795 [Planctomycetes bacterium]|nr:hypothetical protein [Planctomycetota bacterium]